MKIFASRALLALTLGACAPAARPAAAPAPEPRTAPTTPTAPAADTTRSEPAQNWWLLDPATDSVRGTAAERAYRELLAGKQPKRTVVVAIIDSGVDLQHEDLDDNLWKNPGETPGNGRDDDRNGYVDDVHGWNFIGGPDGRNVEQDTYELTRLYARLRERCAAANASQPPECAQFPEIRREFEEKRGEAEEMLSQIQQFASALERVTAVLRAEVGTDSLTAERVERIRSIRPEVVQAQQIYLRVAAAGITAELIERDRKEIQKRLQFNLNPEFNPRPIVGDRPNDLQQRHYGNADAEGPDPEHGTHVAGIVGAERGNNRGIQGIAPAVRLMSIRAVPDGDERDKDVANAIRYAVDNGAQVINMSFGKAHSPEKQVVDDAVRYADSKGVLMVHAAGNDAANADESPNFPTRTYLSGGEAKNWIEVGASSWMVPDSLAASFSNYGRRTVDVFAPGVDIHSTVPNNEYEENSGTSMASPVVAGLAALIMAYHPELSAAEVKQVILESAVRYPNLRVALPGGEESRPFAELSITGGVVNAYRALQLAEQRARR